MANADSRDELFRGYLTRNLPDQELSAFADRLLGEPELSDDLRDFEIEWIDARARGELDAAEAAQVDAYLRETRQEHRLATARRFSAVRTASAKAPPRRPSPYWLAAAAALVLGVFAWQSNRPAATPPSPDAQTPSPHAQTPSAAPTFAILLTPGTRSAEPRRLTLPPGTAQLELKLALDAPLPAGAYQAALQSSTGQEILKQAVPLAEGGTSLNFAVPAASLPPGSYRVLVFQTANSDELINAYSFELRPAAR